MWPFSKKKEKAQFKATKKIVYVTIDQVEVGITFIKLKFSDKRQFITFVTGEVYQYQHDGTEVTSDYSQRVLVKEPSVDELKITNSLAQAEIFLKSLNEFKKSYLDKPVNPTKSAFGVVIEAKILKTKPYKISTVEAKLENI